MIRDKTSMQTPIDYLDSIIETATLMRDCIKETNLRIDRKIEDYIVRIDTKLDSLLTSMGE